MSAEACMLLSSLVLFLGLYVSLTCVIPTILLRRVKFTLVVQAGRTERVKFTLVQAGRTERVKFTLVQAGRTERVCKQNRQREFASRTDRESLQAERTELNLHWC